MNRKNSMLEALKHEHQLCNCGSSAGPPGGLGHDEDQCGFSVTGSNEYINQEPEVNPLISSTSLASVVSPMPSSSAASSSNANRRVFHRKFQSEENHLIKSASSTFTAQRTSRPTTNTSETPDYYELLLRHTEEQRRRREFEDLIFRSRSDHPPPVPPAFPPPSAPPEPPKLAPVTTDDYTPPEPWTSHVGSFFLSRPNSGDEELPDQSPIDAPKPPSVSDQPPPSPSPMAPPSLPTIAMPESDAIDAPVDFAEPNRLSSEFGGLSVDENTVQDGIIPRSPVETRKFKKGSKRPLKPVSDNNLSPTSNQTSFDVNDNKDNSEYSSSYSCSPDPSPLNETMELHRAAESIAQIVDENDIQSRPLPPIPIDQDSFDEESLGEPEESPPSPKIVAEHAYETVIHKRAVSDHVLGGLKATNPAVPEKASPDLKKSHSDRSAESPPPAKALSMTSSISVSTPTIAPYPDGLQSNVHPARHSYYPTTASSSSDGRKRSTTTDASGCETPKGSRARLSPTESEAASVRIRPDSKSLSQRSSNTRSYTEISPSKKPSFSSIVSRLTSSKKSDSSLNSSTLNLSVKSDKLDKEKKATGFKWRSLFTSSKSTNSSFDDSHSIGGSPIARPVPSNAPLTRSASSSSAKFLTRYDDSRISPRLMTLPEDVDISTPWHGESTAQASVLRRSWKVIQNGISSKSPSPNANSPIVRDRRASIIGDMDCDRRIWCVSDEVSNMLDQFIERKGLKHMDKSPTRHPSVTLTDDDEVYEDEEARILELHGNSGRISPDFKTLPRLGLLTDRHRPPSSDIGDRGKDVLSQPKIRSGKCVKRRRPRELHRRRSAHQIREYPCDADSGLPAALRVQVPMQRSGVTNVTSVDKLPLPISKKKVKTPNKNYQQQPKKGLSGLFSLRGNGKKHKSAKNDRDLVNLFRPAPNSPVGQPVTFSRLSNDFSPKQLPDSLANVFGSDYHHKPSTSSDGLRTPLGVAGHQAFFDDSPPSPQLQKDKWRDLELWLTDEPENWSQKHAQENLKVSTTETKRQNIIYELYLTEKKHVQVIIFLQQTYQVGIRSLEILTEDQLVELIPDVLDSMLDFHLNFLRRLRHRIIQKPVVDTVSDIIIEEFSPNGHFVNTAVQAYTSFCLSKDDSSAMYHDLIAKNHRAKKFFDYYESDPQYKKHSFKSCLLLIAQRLTKYNVLVQEISKYDTAEASKVTKEALRTVQDFAGRINTELQRNYIQKRWDKLKADIDKKSKGKLLSRDFTFEDLVHDERMVLAIGETEYQTTTQNHKETISLTMVLFDDVLVFFSRRGSNYVFCNHNLMHSVVPLKRVLVREIPRSCEFHLVVTDAERPDMYKLSFPNKSQLSQWSDSIQRAKTVAPEVVRFAPGRAPQPQCEEIEDPEEQLHAIKHAKWLETLEKLFERLKAEDTSLTACMERRMDVTEDINSHFEKMPTRSLAKLSSSASSSQLPTKLERRETREIEKVRNLVKSKLSEIREHRHLSLNGLVEAAQRCSILCTDFVAELAVPSSSDSSTGIHGSPAGDAGFSSTGTSSEDEPVSRGKPRRVRTYHGTPDSQPRDSLRRHTTVPKMKSDGTPETEDEQEAQLDEECRKLPFVMPLKARKAAKQILKESITLKLENEELRRELAMREMHIASLRKPALHETGEKLEQLRKKTEEMNAFEANLRKEQEAFKDEVARKKEQFEEREAALQRREAELAASQYAKASFRSGACVLQQPALSPSDSTEMKALISKSKTISASTTKQKRKP